MPTLVSYDPDTGTVRHTAIVGDGLELEEYQLLTDLPPALARRKHVDTSGDEPTLVDNPEWEEPRLPPALDKLIRQFFAEVPLRRAHVSSETKAAWRDARDAGDLQTQLDILFEVVTGEVP